MSDYTYSDPDGDTLRLLTSIHGGRVILIAKGEFDAKEIHIPNTDVPTVAAELLKAAGYDHLADLVGWESAEKKLQERRDGLLRGFRAGARWDYTSELAQLAINRIIELEDAAK